MTTQAKAPAQSLAEHVGEVLARARGERRSRGEVAQSLGVAPINLIRIERGEDNPTLARLERVAKALGGHLEVQFVPDDDSG